MDSQICPHCNSPYGYQDQHLWICPECAHEWALSETTTSDENGESKFVDVNGVELVNGDTVKTSKELKVGSATLKSGTKVKNIRLLDEPVNGHDISCKVEGLGQIYLKCSVVKKA